MQTTLKNWPALVATIGAALAPVIVKQGWLTVEQVGAVGVVLAPIFTAIVHRLQSPAGKP